MSFSASNALTLPHPLHLTISKIGEPTHNEAVARLSPILTLYDERGRDRVWITDDDLEVEITPGRKTLAELEVVSEEDHQSTEEGVVQGGDGGRRVVERIAFSLRNEVAVPLYTYVVNIEGHRVWDPLKSTVLYTCYSTSVPKITTRWLRKLEPSPTDPEGETLVSEEIRGTCPMLLRYLTEKETRRAQKVHMSGYVTLF